MDTKRITLITQLEINPGSLDDAALHDRMRSVAEYPFRDAMFNGATDAEVERWSVDVRIGPGIATPAGRALLTHAVLGAPNGQANASDLVSERRGADDPLGSVHAAIENLCLQIEQMRGMFGDEDGNIAGALQDAEDAYEILGRLRARARRAQDKALDATPAVVVSVSDEGVVATSTHPIRLTVLGADVPDDWSAPIALVDGDKWQANEIDVQVSPRAVEACARQIEHALDIHEALGDAISDELQEQLDDLVYDTVMGRYAAEHGDLDDNALAEAEAEAEAEASAINNEGVEAQVCEIVAYGNLERLKELAGLVPNAAPGAGAVL